MPPAVPPQFNVPASAYDGFIGRYSDELAKELCAVAGIENGMRVLEVGCGTGALTEELVRRAGAGNVAAVEPSDTFAAACRERNPGAEVHQTGGEALPFEDDSFDAALSQLVLNFMADPLHCVREMLRVTKPGGIVASCVWDYAGEMKLLRAFWDAAIDVDPSARDSDEGMGMHPRNPLQLRALWEDARMTDVETGELHASAAYESFDALWEPLTSGVGAAGAYCAALSEDDRQALREALFLRLGKPGESFELPARAWWVRGVNSGR